MECSLFPFCSCCQAGAAITTVAAHWRRPPPRREKIIKRFTDAGRAALANDNLYAALTLALTLPDICCSLETPGRRTVGERYIAWCREWLQPVFTSESGGETHVYLSAEDCFQMRCGLIHHGSDVIEPKKRDVLHEFKFVDKEAGVHLAWLEGNVFNGVRQPNILVLRADLFSDDVFQAVERWDAAKLGDEGIQAEKIRLLKIWPKGTSFGGIGFG